MCQFRITALEPTIEPLFHLVIADGD